jgi:hypothetical protein
MNDNQIALDKKNLDTIFSMFYVIMGRSSKDLRYLEEHRNSLKHTLEEILESEDPLRILQAHEILKCRKGLFNNIHNMCGGGYIISPIETLAEKIENAVEKNEMNSTSPKMTFQLKTANWSIPRPIVGKVFILNAFMTPESVASEIERIRKKYFGMIIFLVDGKAPVAILARWPDPTSIIVAGQGGATSECMNFVRGKIPYVNGAWDYFGELKKYVGEIIKIEP